MCLLVHTRALGSACHCRARCFGVLEEKAHQVWNAPCPIVCVPRHLLPLWLSAVCSPFCPRHRLCCVTPPLPGVARAWHGGTLLCSARPPPPPRSLLFLLADVALPYRGCWLSSLHSTTRQALPDDVAFPVQGVKWPSPWHLTTTQGLPDVAIPLYWRCPGRVYAP